MIHVMAVSGLGGTAMSAPVVGYDTIAVLEEEQHLRVPVVRGQRPTVTEDNRLSFAPIFVIDLCSIFGRNCRHSVLSLIAALYFDLINDHRTFSDKNHVLRSVSSIQFSIKLAVATSLCISQTSCVRRKKRVSSRLSARRSANISSGRMDSRLSSFKR